MSKQETTSSWYFVWWPTGVKYGCISLGNVTHPSAHLCTSCDIGAAVCSLWELCILVYRNHGDEMSSDQEQRWAPENTCKEDAAAEELFGGKSGGDWRHRKGLMHALHRAGRIWSQLRNKFRPRTEGRRKCSLLPAWSGELGWWSYINMFTLSLFSNFFLHVYVFIVWWKKIYLQPWKERFLALLLFSTPDLIFYFFLFCPVSALRCVCEYGREY